jgi:hypothetical protein
MVDLQNRLPTALVITRALLLLALLPVTLFAAAADKTEACFVNGPGQGLTVTLEVARTPAVRGKGLMGRDQLPAGHGMLFIYPSMNDPERGFWMHNTLIPLDIAYLDASQRIVSILTMQPCRSEKRSDCPVYPAGVAFQYAVEMNAGYFEQNRINTGHRLVWDKPLPSACQRTQSDH